MKDPKHWFTKAAVHQMISVACKNHGLLERAGYHATRSVFYVAKGLEALAFSMGAKSETMT